MDTALMLSRELAGVACFHDVSFLLPGPACFSDILNNIFCVVSTHAGSKYKQLRCVVMGDYESVPLRHLLNGAR